MIVYKIGGSLLDLPELPGIVRDVLAQRKQHAALFVVGGGPAGNVVRDWDRRHALGDETSHELALAAMDLTAALFSKLIPGLREVRSVHQVHAAAKDNVGSLLCADCFIKSAEAQGHPRLEYSWRVTSDSIAAWTAGVVAADALVLFKSVPLPNGITLAGGARDGLVDEAFPELAGAVPTIGWVNARAAKPLIETWK